jgi:hypothetical protein
MPCSIRKDESSRQIQRQIALPICEARASSRCIMLTRLGTSLLRLKLSSLAHYVSD